MVNNQNSRSKRNHQLKNVGRARAALVCLVIACSTSLVACQSLGNEEGALPDAIRSTGAVVSGSGYPDLSKIPAVPKNLPNQKNWRDFEAGLQSDARRITLQAGAQPVTAMEIDQTWARQEKSNLEASPNALQIDPTPTDDLNWAAKARARLEADIARLPPS